VKAGATVLIHDGTAADAVPLTKKAEHVGHQHPLPKMQVVVTGNGTFPVAIVTGDSPGNTQGASSITGTTVLKAK
jgi:hypothetical protein